MKTQSNPSFLDIRPFWKRASEAGLTFLLLCAITSAEEVTNPESCQVPFWIISTRECDQESPGDTPDQLQYTRVHSPEKHEESTLESFLSALSPQTRICIFVHGNFVSRDFAEEEAGVVFRSLNKFGQEDQDVEYEVLSWPSERILPITRWDLSLKTERADVTAHYLAQLVDRIPVTNAIAFIGYSLGARSVSGTLEILAGGAVGKHKTAPTHSPSSVKRPLHAVLIAASIDHDWLNPDERFGNALSQLEKILILRNSDDLALAFYPLRKLFSPGALGRVGLKKKDWEKLSGLEQKIKITDVEEIVGCSHDSDNYFNSTVIAKMIVPYVFCIPSP